MPQSQLPAVFVLTFPGAGPERHRAPQREFDRLPLIRDWSLVVGFGPQDQIIGEVYDATQNLRWMKRPLSSAEIAVYAGHRKMYAEFLSGPSPFGLFLEDDFQIVRPDEFQYLVDHVEEAIGGADMLKLFNFSDKPGKIVKQRWCGPLNIVKRHRNSAGAVGYVLSRQGAEKLLAREKIYRQIDEDFKHPWEFDFNICAIEPNLVIDNSLNLGGSLLHNGRRAIRLSHRNVIISMKGNYLSIRRKVLGLYHSLLETNE